jgi:DNA-binding response OmpR family regulator
MARVLVIDDNEPFLQTLGLFLEASGHAAVLAGNGRMALKFFSEQVPDVVLMDVNLSDIPGLELCAMLKEKAAGRDVPVIMMTGRPREATAAVAAEVGACEVLTKPFELYLLERLIRRYIAAGGKH